jgi:hypothetical protein
MGQPSVQTTAEEIRDYAPEIIVMIPCGYYKEDICANCRNRNYPQAGTSCPP